MAASDPPLQQATETAGERVVDFLRAVRRRWLLLLGVTALVTGVALAVSLSSEKQYDATAKLLLNRTDPVNNLLDPNGSAPSNDRERDINTDLQLIELDDVANRVRRRLRTTMSGQELLSKIEPKSEATSDIVSIRARDTSPARAAAIANGFALEYVSFRRRSARQSIDDAVELARTQLEGLSQEARNSAQGRQLEARLRELQIAGTLQTGGVEVVSRATRPEDPSRPRPLLSAGLGILLGLLLAVAIALIFEFADRRLKDEEMVEEVYGLPILAAVPRPARRSDARHPGDDPNQREAYGMLAANLRFSSLSAEASVLMITSPGPEEGKTNVTLGLARALAALGQRVIAIEADLRRPAFARYGEIQDAPGGLVETILSGQGLSEHLLWLDAATFEPVTSSALREGTSFAIMPVRAMPTNPQRMLARPEMGRLLKEARALADFVLIDTAPVGTVNDAVTLTNHADGVLIVSRLNKTTKDSARRTLQLLRHFDLQLPGVVITDVDTGGDGYMYYGLTEEQREASRMAPA